MQKNVGQALQFFERSSDGGNEKGMFNLALRYEFGEGTQKSKERAIQLYKKAERLGHEEATTRLREFRGDGKLQ